MPEPVAFYIADRALPVGTEMGAEAMPVRAFNEGDRVPVGHVERYGWQPYVHPWPPPATDSGAVPPDEPGGNVAGEE